MGSFPRAFLGYRRAEVHAAIDGRDARIAELEKEIAGLSEMVVGREREMRSLREALSEANDRHDRNLLTLQMVAMRVEEIHAQARGQATRIRMQALADAVETTRRMQELAASLAIQPAGANGGDPASSNRALRGGKALFEGLVEVDIGPLGDFSQLVGFEDAAERIGGASEISIRKFSEGRATLEMRLDEPVELLRELEERSPLDFRVRRTDKGRVVLDLDDGAEAA